MTRRPTSRTGRRPSSSSSSSWERPSAAWLDAAGALYLAGVREGNAGARAARPLDAVVAAFLREHASARALGDTGRGFVVDVAQAMWRCRRRCESAVARLAFEPTRGALVALYLAGARGYAADALPVDRRGVPALVDAWRATDADAVDVRASLPPWLAERLGAELALAMTQAPPAALRANTLRVESRKALIEALAREGIAARESALSPDGVVLVERKPLHRTRAFADGMFEIQDEGSQLVSRHALAGMAPGEACGAKRSDEAMLVVDGCAGAGGKTLHLAALLGGRGSVYAFDVAGHRLRALRERARRAGAHNVRVHELDGAGRNARKRLHGRADVVVVDAPCSGTGVLRRNPDTGWRLTLDDVARLVHEQRAILDDYAPLVRPGGRLVYATCSLLDDENDGVVDAFLARHAPRFTRAHASGAGGATLLRLDPVRHACDGFYACTLVRARDLD